jgi:hypothetical protein
MFVPSPVDHQPCCGLTMSTVTLHQQQDTAHKQRESTYGSAGVKLRKWGGMSRPNQSQRKHHAGANKPNGRNHLALHKSPPKSADRTSSMASLNDKISKIKRLTKKSC